MNSKNNNNRAYAYHPHETEICHGGRLGCWVKPESGKDRAARLAGRVLVGLAFAILAFGFCVLCSIA